MNTDDAMQPDEFQTTEQLLPLVYAELRRLAAHKMASENPGQTLQPTALLHEAWLKLVGQENRRWPDRNHFFAAAAQAMCRILTDNARRLGWPAGAATNRSSENLCARGTVSRSNPPATARPVVLKL